MNKIQKLFLGFLLFPLAAYAATWKAEVDEVYVLRDVRVDHSDERPRGWLNPFVPIPVVHRVVYGREAAATLFLGVPGGGIGFSETDPMRFHIPAKLVDNPTEDHEVNDPNLMKATLGIYAHSRDKRTAWGRRQTFNRIVHLDTYVRLPLGYPLTSNNADTLRRAELKMDIISSEVNAESGCSVPISGLKQIIYPIDIFSLPVSDSGNVILEQLPLRELAQGTDYTRVDDRTFEITELIRNWMRESGDTMRPLAFVLMGAENPPPAGLTTAPNVGKYRKRRHAIRWLRTEQYRKDNNEWEFFCFHNAANMRLELEF